MRLVNFVGALCLAATSQALGQAEKAKSAHDPPGQLFRHAPMSNATRSIVIPLGGIRFAFDTEQLRTHTVWHGELDLYGPQHAHAKRPFIAQPNGQLLWGNPPDIPWQTQPPTAASVPGGNRLTGRFTGTTTEGDRVSLHYELKAGDGERVAIRLTPSLGQRGVRRTLTLGACRQPLWFLANSFAEGESKREVRANGPEGVTIRVINIPMKYTEPIVTEEGAESVYDVREVLTDAEQ
ncbi:MAG: hypothetical protein QGF56_10050, partial [Verrucomicrobiota bacterium]|nr:hypothetical protein [Verrucomicrobiota bacterium]